MRSGKHVLVEIPVTDSVEDAEQLVRIALPSMKQRCPVGGGYMTTLTARGMTGHGHSLGEPNKRLSGTVRP